MTSTAAPRLSRTVNRSAVLQTLRLSGPLSQSELAGRLALSLPTVMRTVEELRQECLIQALGTVPSEGGRPRTMLALNHAAHAVVAVDLGGSKMHGAVLDLAGQVQHEIRLEYARGDHLHALDRLYDLVDGLLAAPRPPDQRVRGIGIGAPGIVRNPEGVVEWAPSLEWRQLPLKQLLSDRFGLPVFVENDVNLAALGELDYGAGRGADSIVCIAIGTGIGAGIVIRGSIYTGAHQIAGEIGYFLPGLRFLPGSSAVQTEQAVVDAIPAGFGALETVASGAGIAARASRRRSLAAVQNGGDGTIGDEPLTTEQVFTAARAGERWAQEVIDETVDYLSLAVANICALLDPEVVVLGGGIARSADLLIEPILCRLRGVLPRAPRLVASPLDRLAGVMGAVTLVLNATAGHSPAHGASGDGATRR